MRNFPKLSPDEDDQGTLEDATALSAWVEKVGNYLSADEHSAKVEDELKKELEKGFLKWSACRAELEEGRGELILSSWYSAPMLDLHPILPS